MHRIKTARERIGKCNICLKDDKLTWDHVPPQGCSNFDCIEIYSFYSNLKKEHIKEKALISQNGLKYRTLCGSCNSLLGSEYDDELNNFVKGLVRFVNTKLIIPSIIHLKANPTKLIKSILGHVLAGTLEISDSKIDNEYRKIVLNIDERIPDDLNVFYWIYTEESTIVMRDFLLCNVMINPKDFGILQLLKFFPVAFVVTSKKELNGLPSLTNYINKEKAEECVKIPIYMNHKINPDWPEKIGDDEIAFVTGETGNSVVTKTRKAKH